MALLLAGVLACMPLMASAPQPAWAAGATPTKVDVTTNTTGVVGDGMWIATVNYSDGTMRTLQIATLTAANINITVHYLSQGINAKTENLVQSKDMQALPGDSAPGVLIGAINPSFGDDQGFLYGNAYATSTACAASGTCLVAGLAAKPQTQTATVAAVPTTGAPSSDLALPAALLAAGMVGGGLLIRKRRDRGRA